MKQKLFFIGLLALMLLAGKGWGQPWTYNFGTSTGTYNTNNSASTTFLPSPEENGGTARVRRSNNQGGSFIMESSQTGKIGSGSRFRIEAPTGGSVNKFSIYDYTTPGKSFYTKFAMLLGGSDGGNVASGTWYFFQGDGATYSDNSSFSSAQVFTGLRFVFGASGAITLEYRAAAWTYIRKFTSFSKQCIYSGNIWK
jgi:hypothetical protein